MCLQKACPHSCTSRLSQAGGTGRGERRELLPPLPSPLACTHPHLVSSNVASLHKTLFWHQQELSRIHRKMVWKHLISYLWPPSFASPDAFLKAIYSEASDKEPVTIGSR